MRIEISSGYSNPRVAVVAYLLDFRIDLSIGIRAAHV
jgi:hypothetical protein